MKKNNKGFSLVELIIVIAIMAILAGAIAPALIRYIDKSRKSNDVTAAKTIKTAVETAMANEKTYEYLTSGTADANDNTGVINIQPGATTASGNVTISATLPAGTDLTNADKTNAEEEIFKNIGESVPRIKYKKPADGVAANAPSDFVVTCTKGGTIAVYISKGGNDLTFQLCPEICSYYQ